MSKRNVTLEQGPTLPQSGKWQQVLIATTVPPALFNAIIGLLVFVANIGRIVAKAGLWQIGAEWEVTILPWVQGGIPPQDQNGA